MYKLDMNVLKRVGTGSTFLLTRRNTNSTLMITSPRQDKIWLFFCFFVGFFSVFFNVLIAVVMAAAES